MDLERIRGYDKEFFSRKYEPYFYINNNHSMSTDHQVIDWLWYILHEITAYGDGDITYFIGIPGEESFKCMLLRSEDETLIELFNKIGLKNFVKWTTLQLFINGATMEMFKR